MNHIYRSIWNDKAGTFIAASENAMSGGKKSSPGAGVATGQVRFAVQALAGSLLLAFGANIYALPTGGAVAAGSASIAAGTGTMTVNQSSQNAAINWQNFSIGKGEAVLFVQPNSNSVALNRVLGSDPSSILGSLTANGKVFLVNPNGILFGRGASVNVGSLVASTLNVSDADFMAGKYNFSGTSNGAVVNQGSINANGGYVALLGANVSNEGVISAQLGTVALAAGNAITLDVAGDGLLNVAVSQGTVNALVQNGGLIQADGGQVMLTAQAAGSLLKTAVNNTGVIQAQTIQNHNGSIKLLGDMQSGTVNVGGTLDASAPAGGNGGFVETSAAHVKVANDAKITTLASAGKTGTWLIDPTDYTVAAGGGNITGAALGTNLDSTNVTLDSTVGGAGTAGNVNVNDAVSWTGTTTLTMKAVNDVNINQAITGINGSVDAIAGHDVNVAAATKTTTGMLKLTAVNDVAITAATTIITGNMTAVAGHDVKVSAASTITTGDMILRADNDGTGPGVAAGTVAITCGSNCLTITTGNLSIRFNPASYATTGAEITAYGAHLTGAGVLDAKAWVFGKGDNKMYDGTTAATVSGLKPDVGGVAPPVVLGAVSNANFDTKHVGISKPITYNSTFTNAVYELFAPFAYTPGTYLARGDITVRPLTIAAVTDTKQYDGTTSSVGVPTAAGLQVGDTLNGALTQTFTSKNVMGTNGSTLVATGPYTVTDGNGGANYTVTVNNALGTITPMALVGAITAANKMYDGNNTATILTRTLTAPVAGDNVSYVGGTALFSDKNVANGKTVTGTGLSLAGADAVNYTVNTTATTLANITPAPLTVTAKPQSKTYGTLFAFAGTEFTNTALVGSETIGTVTLTSAGTPATAHVAGSPYPIVPSAATGGSFSPSNYTITYANGPMVVNPAPLTLTANDQSKVYGTALPVPGTAFTSTTLQNGDTIASVTMTSVGTPAAAPVGGSPYPITITPGSATGGTFVPTDYTVGYVPGKMTVTPAALTVTASDATKVYGQTPVLTAFTTTALQNGETVGSVTEVSPGTVATAAVPGPYAITPSAANGGTFTPGNYAITYVNGKMVVTPAPLTVTASDATKVFGQTPVLTAFTTTPLQNGEVVSSVTETSPGTASEASIPGPYPITASGATGTFAPGNYTITYVDGKLTVTPAVVAPPVPPIVVPPAIPAIVAPPVYFNVAEGGVKMPPVLMPQTTVIQPAPIVVLPEAPVAQPAPPVEQPAPAFVPIERPRKKDRN
jgi:filamentous hemagglutinin family protein